MSRFLKKRAPLWLAASAALLLALAFSHLIRSQSLDEAISRTPGGEWQLTWRSVPDGE